MRKIFALVFPLSSVSIAESPLITFRHMPSLAEHEYDFCEITETVDIIGDYLREENYEIPKDFLEEMPKRLKKIRRVEKGMRLLIERLQIDPRPVSAGLMDFTQAAYL